MGRVNDISFEIGGKLVILIEHQSTINPNMAVRLLMYIGRVYEKLVGDRKIYTSKLIPLPRPEFFVLYNGVSPYPDEKILKLSEAFEPAASLGLPEKGNPSLELTVKVININEGRNEGIVRKCKTLGGYSAFVEKLRGYKKEGCSIEEAMKKAVIYCRDHDILKEFLEENATEVLNMLTEWNQEVAQQVWYEDGLEDGLEKGREETARNALAKGLSLELVHDITGLDIEALKALSARG
jgi:predicted transposase/invertase (TIGR01784 family)